MYSKGKVPPFIESFMSLSAEMSEKSAVAKSKVDEVNWLLNNREGLSITERERFLEKKKLHPELDLAL